MADNVVHRRRMREVVAFLERESQVEHQFTQSPEEHLFKSLSQLGMIAFSGQGKSVEDIIEKSPPMFELPNQLRRDYDDYYHEEFISDEIFEELNIEIYFEESDESEFDFSEPDEDFSDPYGEDLEWRENRLGEPEERILRGRNSIPVFHHDGDETFESNYDEAHSKEGMEVLGWYNPRGSNRQDEWGIYIRRGAPAEIAERFFGHMENRYEAWNLALRMILHHEYFHFLSQYHCDRLSSESPHDEKYFRYLSEWMKNPSQAIEEAVANAYAIRNGRLTKSEKSAVSLWFSCQPEPYYEYLNYITPVDYQHGLSIVAHMHNKHDISGLTDVNLSLATMFRPKPKEMVRVFFVNDVIDSPSVPKLVTFERVTLHKNILKMIQRRKLPKDIGKALKEFIHDISGNSYDRYSKHGFVRAKDKIHWRFELPRKYRGLMTQARDTNGWSVVFVGSHSNYDAYCDAKGVRHK